MMLQGLSAVWLLAVLVLDLRLRTRKGQPMPSQSYFFFWYGGLARMIGGVGDHYAGRESATAFVVRAVAWWAGLPALVWWGKRQGAEV